MLRIYSVALEMVREIRPLADRIANHDKDHARQLRRSSMSIVLNIAERQHSRLHPRPTRVPLGVKSST